MPGAPRTDPSVRDYRTGLLPRVRRASRELGADERSASLPAASATMPGSRPSGSESGPCGLAADSPWPSPFPPAPPQTVPQHRPCSKPSSVLWACPTPYYRPSLNYSLRIRSADPGPSNPGPAVGSPGSRAECLCTRLRSLTAPGPTGTRDSAPADVAFSPRDGLGTRKSTRISRLNRSARTPATNASPPPLDDRRMARGRRESLLLRRLGLAPIALCRS